VNYFTYNNFDLSIPYGQT